MLGGPWLAAKLIFRKESADGSYIAGEINTTETEWWVNAVCLGVGVLLIAVGLYFAWITFQDQRRKLLIAIELRGLSQTADSPLQSAIPLWLSAEENQYSLMCASWFKAQQHKSKKL